MATGSAYLTYVETEIIGGNTFHAFRVRIAKDPYWLVKYILSIQNETLPLLLLDLVAVLPSTIAQNTEFDKESGGTFLTPSDLSYAFITAKTFHEAAKPTSPAEANVIIAQALFAECVAYYAETEPYPGMVLPGDNSPDDYEPDVNGWYYPPYAEFDFIEKVVAQRSVGFQTASLDWLYSWIYDGCTNDPDYHVMETLDEATFNINGIYTWTAAQYIDCCNAGTGTGYLIEEGGSGGSTYVSVWLFSPPDPDSVKQFSPLLLGPRQWKSPVEIIASAGYLLAQLVPHSPLVDLRKLARFNLHAKHIGLPLGESPTKPFGESPTKPMGASLS